MGNRHSQLPHKHVVAYLLGRSEEVAGDYIAKLKNDDQVIHILFELIDRYKVREQALESPYTPEVSTTFSDMEELLLRLFSGEAGNDDIQQFTAGLVGSPVFYERLLINLSQTLPEIPLDEVPQIAQIRIKTDEEILALVKSRGKRTVPRLTGVVTPARRWSAGEIRILAYAFAFLIVAISVFFLRRPIMVAYDEILDKIVKQDEYVYDEKTPYPDVSGLRGPSATAEVDTLFDFFVDHFKLGMSDYLRRDYSRAIREWEKLRYATGVLQARRSDDDFLQWLRDYYFYLGASHFALTRSRKLELAPEVKTQHTSAAIQFLARADSLAQAHHFENADREAFFLALALGFAGEEARALAELEKIDPGSEFFEARNQLITKWSKQ